MYESVERARRRVPAAAASAPPSPSPSASASVLVLAFALAFAALAWSWVLHPPYRAPPPRKTDSSVAQACFSQRRLEAQLESVSGTTHGSEDCAAGPTKVIQSPA